MTYLSFIYQYITKPRSVGAIMPSSKYLADRMIENIDFEHAKCIVEFGPGTGAFTELLVKNKHHQTTIFLIENNNEFYNHLIEKFEGEHNVIIINGSAENIDHYLRMHHIKQVDYVVSGLPFASLPKKVSRKIMAKTKSILQKEGIFITFQYSKVNQLFFREFFSTVGVKHEIRNMPPAYVFTCNNESLVKSSTSS